MSGPLAIGLLFVALGASILAWLRPLVRAYVGLLRPMRGLFGGLVEWEIGLLEGKWAPRLVRLFGGFVILSGLSVFFYMNAGAAAR